MTGVGKGDFCLPKFLDVCFFEVKMERVDILLATYNGEKYLREQIDSILNQSYKDFRLIISDDCSQDNTKSILDEYVQKDGRIIVYCQKKNLGVTQNFEFLLSKVESDYYMFSDQDDIWKEDKIEKCINKIKEENADLVYSDLEVVDENLNVIYDSYWKLKGFYNRIKNYNDFKSLYLNNYITGCTMHSKKEWIERILPFPKNSEFVIFDYWIALMISQDGKMVYIEEPLTKYRQHKKNTIGSKKRSDSINSFWEMRDLFIRVKIEHFETFVKNEKRFKSEEIRSLSRDSLKYFKMLAKIKHANFKSWGLFFKLYKFENFKYKMENFMILNFPGITKLLFKVIRHK